MLVYGPPTSSCHRAHRDHRGGRCLSLCTLWSLWLGFSIRRKIPEINIGEKRSVFFLDFFLEMLYYPLHSLGRVVVAFSLYPRDMEFTEKKGGEVPCSFDGGFAASSAERFTPKARRAYIEVFVGLRGAD